VTSGKAFAGRISKQARFVGRVASTDRVLCRLFVESRVWFDRRHTDHERCQVVLYVTGSLHLAVRSPGSVVEPSAVQMSDRHSTCRKSRQRLIARISLSVVPCHCVLHEDSVVDPPVADHVLAISMVHSECEEFAERGDPLTDFVGYIPPRFDRTAKPTPAVTWVHWIAVHIILPRRLSCRMCCSSADLSGSLVRRTNAVDRCTNGGWGQRRLHAAFRLNGIVLLWICSSCRLVKLVLR
jgi:hypothetical protein